MQGALIPGVLPDAADVGAVGPCRIQLNETQSVFCALSEAIVYQQLTGKSSYGDLNAEDVSKVIDHLTKLA